MEASKLHHENIRLQAIVDKQREALEQISRFDFRDPESLMTPEDIAAKALALTATDKEEK